MNTEPDAITCSGVDDTAERYSIWSEYVKPNGLTYRVEHYGFVKRNPFANDRGAVLVEIDGVRSERPEAELVKTLSERDTPTNYECAVEYRLPGSDVIVHRSAHVHAKQGMAMQMSQGAIG